MGKELILVTPIEDVKYEGHIWRKGLKYELEHLDYETDRFYSDGNYLDLDKSEIHNLLQNFEFLKPPVMTQTEQIQCPHCYYVN